MRMKNLIPFTADKNLPSINSLFEKFHRDIDRLLAFPNSKFFTDVNLSAEIKENEKGLKVSLEMPGVEPEEVKITIRGDVLFIRGEKKNYQTSENDDYYISERTYGTFSRSLRLPYEVKAENIKASFKNGVLSIDLPRAVPSNEKVYSVKINS